jgi:hypothetical protein
MEQFDINAEEVDKELFIDNSSVFALSEELKNHSRKESKYIRLAAMANKEVSKLSLELKVTESELVDEYMKQQTSQSASLRQEIRKSIVRDERYKKVAIQLYQAQANADLLNGLVQSWVGRGYQLREIAKLAGYTMKDGPQVFVGDPYKKSAKALEALDKED